MHGIWSWQWHSVLLVLLLHIVLYALIFLFCAFFAARHFRRMRNPVFPRASLSHPANPLPTPCREWLVNHGARRMSWTHNSTWRVLAHMTVLLRVALAATTFLFACFPSHVPSPDTTEHMREEVKGD